MTTGEIPAIGDDHPSADALVDFAEGLAPAATKARVEAHLAECAACREVVADLRAYPDLEPPGPEFRVGRGETQARLAAVKSSLGAGRPSPRHHLGWAAALILACGACLYLWLEARTLEDRLERAAGPQPNVAIVALLPEDDPLRSAEAPALPAGRGLSLSVADEEPFPAGSYRVEIVGPDGATVLAIEALRPDDAGGLAFHLPPGALEPGSYEVMVRGADGAAWPRRFTLRIAS